MNNTHDIKFHECHNRDGIFVILRIDNKVIDNVIDIKTCKCRYDGKESDKLCAGCKWL
jgi:hypothetical protein